MANKRRIVVRRWTTEDIPAVVACHVRAYPDYPSSSHDEPRLFEMQLAAFPEGQVLAEIEGEVVAYATSIIVQLDDDRETYTYSEITGDRTFSTHDPSGDTLYGADIAVVPEYRGQGVAGKLYRYRKNLLRRFNLRRMLAYGRIPGFGEYAGRMTAQEYVDAVERGEVKDPALNAHLKAGYKVRKVLLDFFGDRSSLNYCTLLEMAHPRFAPEKRKIAAAPIERPVRRIRVCAAQYLMRPITRWEEFVSNVEFFCDTANEYHCHFLLFPEYFTAQLFSLLPSDLESRQAIRQLAEMTPRYIELFRELARKHKLYIVAGSHPVDRDGKLFNVAHLVSPHGSVYTQDKLHITPEERRAFGIHPGESIRVFDTPFGRIGIQICYDIEFPEVSRLLKRAGVEVLFVPYSTDEKKAYFRVRYTAQARAVENVVYVVLAGNVGNLPSIRSYLINYGQAAIFTPSDIAFPLEGKLGEAEPNLETVVIADLDLASLKLQAEIGSVRPLYDLRPDLYDLRSKVAVEVIRTD